MQIVCVFWFFQETSTVFPDFQRGHVFLPSPPQKIQVKSPDLGAGSPSGSDIFTSVPHARSVSATPVVSQRSFLISPPPDARLHARTRTGTRPTHALPFSTHTSTHTPVSRRTRAWPPRPSSPTHSPHRGASRHRHLCTPLRTRASPSSSSRS